MQKSVALLLALVLLLTMAMPAVASESIKPFTVSSEAAVVMDYETGQVIYAQNIDNALPPASLTKLMAMYLVFEALELGIITLDERIPASANATNLPADHSQIFLGRGEALTIRELLYSVAIISANDAVIVLAEHLTGSETAFVDLMNDRASELGLTSTNFANVHGIDQDDHLVSARDIAILSREIIRRFPAVLDYTNVRHQRMERETRYVRQGYFFLDSTFSSLIGWRNLDGLKTGWTPQAGRGISATAIENGRRYIVVVLGAETVKSREDIVKQLFNHAFANFETITAYQRDEELELISIGNAKIREVAIAPEADVNLVVRRGSGISSFQEIREIRPNLKAPLSKGDEIGTIKFYNGEELVANVRLLLQEDVIPANIMVRGLRFLSESITQLGRWLMDLLS